MNREATPSPDTLAAALRAAAPGRRPPIHLWNPDFCGDIDMRIAADGTWFYNRTPIGRMPLVKLFASILRREGERHVLVTPVEKVGIAVDDAPFVAVEMAREGEGAGQTLVFRTNVDDVAAAGPDHPLRFERDARGGIEPYLLVRDELWAKLARPLLYDLVELGERETERGIGMFGVRSGGRFFAMAPATEIAEWT